MLCPDEIYERKLQLVEAIIGNGTTWLRDLRHMGTRLFGSRFAGAFASDKIPVLTNETPYAIVNVDKSSEPGSHWVALAKNGSVTLFYDSFGRRGSNLIPAVCVSGNGRIVDVERDAEQRILEANCGARCLAWFWVFDDFGPEAAAEV